MMTSPLTSARIHWLPSPRLIVMTSALGAPLISGSAIFRVFVALGSSALSASTCSFDHLPGLSGWATKSE